MTTIASGAIHGRTLQLEGETCRRRTFARPQRVPPGCLLITARVHRRSEAGPQEVGVPGPPRSRPAFEPGGRERWAGVGAGSGQWRSSAAGHPGPRPGPRRGFSGEPLSGAPGPDRSVTTTRYSGVDAFVPANARGRVSCPRRGRDQQATALWSSPAGRRALYIVPSERSLVYGRLSAGVVKLRWPSARPLTDKVTHS